MSIRNKPHFVDVTIKKFSKKGNGIGEFERQDGVLQSVEVPFTIPEDKVRAMLLRRQSGLYKSRLETITESSKNRIEPRCIHFGVCGGCRWQQMTYDDQLKLKEEQVKKCFKDLVTHEVEWGQILPSDATWHYRNKMEFTFSTDKLGTLYLGLNIDAGKGKVFHLTECHLPRSWYVDAVKAVREWWKEFALSAYHAIKDVGSLQTLTLRDGQQTGDRMVILTVSGNADYALKKHHLESFVAFIRAAIEPDDISQKLSIFLFIKQIKKGQPTRVFEMHLYGSVQIREVLRIKTRVEEEPKPLMFKISPSAFFQPNTLQAEKLYTAAILLSRIPENGVVYDLYCGTGTLGICVAKHAKKVVGIELSRESSLDARQNAEENGATNVTILTGSVQEKLMEIRKEDLFPPPDIVLVDPPRAGLENNSISNIIGLNPKKIVYVSCNPTTQSENVRALVRGGYKLTAIQPVDQFPHTVHIENIAVLTKYE